MKIWVSRYYNCAIGDNHLIVSSDMIWIKIFSSALRDFCNEDFAFEFQIAFSSLLRGSFLLRKVVGLSARFCALAIISLKKEHFIVSLLFLCMHWRRDVEIWLKRNRDHDATFAEWLNFQGEDELPWIQRSF